MDTATAKDLFYYDDHAFPCLARSSRPVAGPEFAAWYQSHAREIEEKLLRTGAILFRGISIRAIGDFESITGEIAVKFVSYVDGNSPRTKLSSRVYTSTEYDPAFPITLHNELSYSGQWPARLFFCCLVPAATGGETPLADCRRIIEAMNPALVEEVERKGINYIRNLNDGEGIGPSWQQTFETNDRRVVEQYCRESACEFVWKADGGLKITQRRPGVIRHPLTGERVWFNQIDQFHPSHLQPEIHEMLMMLYDQDEEELPMFVKFGDGSPVSSEVVAHIRQTVDGQARKSPWQQGDLLLVDNVLVCHGRMPYTGERKVLVALAK